MKHLEKNSYVSVDRGWLWMHAHVCMWRVDVKQPSIVSFMVPVWIPWRLCVSENASVCRPWHTRLTVLTVFGCQPTLVLQTLKGKPSFFRVLCRPAEFISGKKNHCYWRFSWTCQCLRREMEVMIGNKSNSWYSTQDISY